MSDAQPRVALTLPPEFLRILDRISAVTGAGRATIIREWLLDSAPVFVQMAEAFELAASKNPAQSFDLMARMLEELQGDVAKAQVDLGKRRAPIVKRDP